MKKEDILNLMREDSAGKIPDVFEKITSSAQEQGLLNAGQAASLGAAHASAATAGAIGASAAAGGTKIIISSIIAALAVTAAVSGTVGASLAVNYANQPSSSTPPVIEKPDDPEDPDDPPVLGVETQGLEYKELADGSGYAVIGRGESKDTKIVIPKTYNGKPVKEIADDAFYLYTVTLTDFTIQDNIEKIGKRAFPNDVESFTVDAGNARYCVKNNCIIDKIDKVLVSAGKNATIPTDGSVTTIGDYAFYRYKTDVVIPEGITKIGEYAFQDSNIGETYGFTMPSSLEEVGKDAFYRCDYIETVTFKDGFTKLADGAFMECESLKTVNLPVTFTWIEYSVFSGCTALQSINYAGSKFMWDSNVYDSYSFNENKEYGNKLHCSSVLTEADIYGEYYNHNINNPLNDTITFNSDGTFTAQIVNGGSGFVYEGSWTVSGAYAAKDVDISVTFTKYTMTDGVKGAAVGTGTATFHLTWDKRPAVIVGDAYHRYITSSHADFASGLYAR